MRSYKSSAIVSASIAQEDKQSRYASPHYTPGNTVAVGAVVSCVESSEAEVRQIYIDQLKAQIKARIYHLTGSVLARKMLASLSLRLLLTNLLDDDYDGELRERVHIDVLSRTRTLDEEPC